MNKWTTFQKARMVCSVQEEDGTETYFDELGKGDVSGLQSIRPNFRYYNEIQNGEQENLNYLQIKQIQIHRDKSNR